MQRRSFLQLAAAGFGSPPLIACVERAVAQVAHVPDHELARDEAFWGQIRAGYELQPDLINLENG